VITLLLLALLVRDQQDFFMPSDKTYMEQALALAAKGRGRVSPNPLVGCVVVSDNEVVGEGFHEYAGGPHAEVNAFQDIAPPQRKRMTVYVTLEPCAHHGKTPPCVDFLLQEDIVRIVVAMEDPNPLTAGKSLARLREAGVQVDLGCCEAEARRLNEAFIKFITTGRPFVISKCGMTLDGKIASHTGHSKWITSEASRTKVHEIRAEVDGILVGSRTVMLDDPSLTCRLTEGFAKDPTRIILDAEEYLDSKRRIFHLNSEAETWIAVGADRDYPEADAVIHVPQGEGGIDLDALIDKLGARGITSLLIEGGGTTHAAAFKAGIVDKVMFFVAPKILGGRDAVTAVEGTGFETVDAAIQLDAMTATPISQDLLIEAYVRP
jgi:diaminohydroxyphosphoribosylaminopyrimidine deaminase / 5-amino-6-(5-phosphoribosylamino)uracil reductase